MTVQKISGTSHKVFEEVFGLLPGMDYNVTFTATAEVASDNIATSPSITGTISTPLPSLPSFSTYSVRD